MPRFEIDFLPEYTDEALLDELRRVARKCRPTGRSQRTEDGRFAPKVSEYTLRRRFGGWKETLEKAGLGHRYHGQPVSKKMRTQPAKGLSNEDLIAEMKRVFSFLGKEWLSSDDFNAHSVTSETVIRRRFGTFRKGLEAAGIPPHSTGFWQSTDAECFENLITVWTHFGRTPRYRELFNPPSTIQGKTYMLRRGTWRKALKAFVDWANAESEHVEAKESDSAHISTTQHLSLRHLTRAEADCRAIRPGLRFKVFLRDRFRCLGCGKSPATSLDTELHADHILAVANGGKTTLENLQTLCRDCNLGKGRTTVG